MVEFQGSGCRRRQTLALLSGCLLVDAARADTVRVFSDDDYPPLIHRENDQPAGLLVARMRAAEALTPDHLQLELIGWPRAMAAAQRAEGGLLGLSYTRERSAWLDYSEPLMHDPISMVVLRGQGLHPRKLADLQGHVIGMADRASYGETLDRAIAQGKFKVERDWGADKRLRMLLSGRIDIAIFAGGALSLETRLRRSPELWAARERFEIMPDALYFDPLHLGFPKAMGLRPLLDRFNQALTKLPKPPSLLPGTNSPT